MILKEKIKDSISLYLCRYKNIQNFFALKKDDVNVENISENRSFFIVRNIDDFNEICKKFSFTVPDANAEERFNMGDCFCLIAEGDVWGCWGWFTTASRDFYVLEIDASSKIPENAAVLYHYFANPEQRRKGFYYDLLRLVALKNGKEYSIIYAYDTNPASKNAIKKAGYRDFGEMSHKTFCGFSEIIKKYGNTV
ncbi:MAG: hypothetical protein MJ147_08200 [Clostridia bacterium]|nr:hypothetical protein [Clostridia bacterium]